MTTEFDWNQPFGRFTRGTVRMEFFANAGNSHTQISTLYVHDGSKTMKEIRNEYLDSTVRIQVEGQVLFEGTLVALVVSKFQESIKAIGNGIEEFWKNEFNKTDKEREEYQVKYNHELNLRLGLEERILRLQEKLDATGLADPNSQD